MRLNHYGDTELVRCVNRRFTSIGNDARARIGMPSHPRDNVFGAREIASALEYLV